MCDYLHLATHSNSTTTAKAAAAAAMREREREQSLYRVKLSLTHSRWSLLRPFLFRLERALFVSSNTARQWLPLCHTLASIKEQCSFSFSLRLLSLVWESLDKTVREARRVGKRVSLLSIFFFFTSFCCCCRLTLFFFLCRVLLLLAGRTGQLLHDPPYPTLKPLWHCR